MAWRRLKKSGGKRILKGLKTSLDGIKYIGSKVSGEPEPNKEPDRIDFATFSEAIEQYGVVVEDFRKSGMADTALFRIAECFYNMGDYPYALEYFRKVQKEYPNSYLSGEALLGAAQCYIPGGDFGPRNSKCANCLPVFRRIRISRRCSLFPVSSVFRKGSSTKPLPRWKNQHSGSGLLFRSGIAQSGQVHCRHG